MEMRHFVHDLWWSTFEDRISLRKNHKWREERKILNLKKHIKKGSKVIIIWLSFCKKQTNKTKEKSVCPKGFLLTLTTSDFFFQYEANKCALKVFTSWIATRRQDFKLMNCLDFISILSWPAQRKRLRRKQKRCANTSSGASTSPCLCCFVLF